MATTTPATYARMFSLFGPARGIEARLSDRIRGLLAERLPRDRRRRASRPSAGVVRLAGSDPESADLQRFQAAALPHLASAYNFARYLSRNDGIAEDIVHNAFIRALRGYRTFRGDDIRPWLFAIVRNCFNTWAKAQRDYPAASPHGLAAGSGEAAEEIDCETPESILIRNEEAMDLRALIAALPTHYREALVLRELEHLSYRDMSEVLDVPIGTVMSRLARARSLLAAAWEERERATGAEA